MFDVIGMADNYTIVPAPVLDESQPRGYRVEQRMQVILKAASNERAYSVEFRLGESSQAPSEELLNRWIESGEMAQAFCSASGRWVWSPSCSIKSREEHELH